MSKVQIIMSRDIYLDTPVTPITLANPLYVGDNDAQRVRFRVFQQHGDTVPMDLTGVTVMMHFIRPDGGDVVITGTPGTEWSYVDMPQACYAYKGLFAFSVHLISDDQTATTVMKACGQLDKVTTDTIIDPGHVIPSLEELLAKLDDMDDAVTACNAAAAAADAAADNANAAVSYLAPVYSAESTYNAGEYVIQDGKLYRCTADISTAEAWTAAHWTEVVFGDEISNLKSALNETDNALDIVKINTSTNLIDSRNVIGKKCSEAFAFENYIAYIPLNWGENTPVGSYKGYFVLNDGTTDQTNLNAIQIALADENKEQLNTPITQGTFNNTSYSMSVPSNAKYLKLIMYSWTNYTIVRFGLCVFTYVDYTTTKTSQKLENIETTLSAVETNVDSNTEIIADIAQEVAGGSFVDFSAYEGKSLFGADSFFTGSASTRDIDITGLGLSGKNISTFIWLSDSTGYMSGEITESQFDANGQQIYPTSGYHYVGHPMLILPNCAKIRLYATANAYTNHRTATLNHAQLYTTGDEQVDYSKYYVPKTTSKWRGKKWIAYGDSITAQGRWQPFVVEQTGLAHINAGLGGSSVADGNDQSIASFTDSSRISALPSDADVVTIMGGTNDFNGTNGGTGTPIGTLPTSTPFDTTTFKGALCETVRLIQAQCPDALIVIMSNAGGRGTTGTAGTIPIKNSKGLSDVDYANAALDVANYLGLPFVDVHGCGINPYNRVKYIMDSVHPNSFGGELISRPVIAYFTTEQPN